MTKVYNAVVISITADRENGEIVNRHCDAVGLSLEECREVLQALLNKIDEKVEEAGDRSSIPQCQW